MPRPTAQVETGIGIALVAVLGLTILGGKIGSLLPDAGAIRDAAGDARDFVFDTADTVKDFTAETAAAGLDSFVGSSPEVQFFQGLFAGAPSKPPGVEFRGDSGDIDSVFVPVGPGVGRAVGASGGLLTVDKNRQIITLPDIFVPAEFYEYTPPSGARRVGSAIKTALEFDVDAAIFQGANISLGAVDSVFGADGAAYKPIDNALDTASDAVRDAGKFVLERLGF